MSARGQVDSHQATNSQKDMLVLSSHFLSQPVPDTRKKSFLYDGSHTSQRDLLNKAFKALMCRRSKKRQKGLPVIDRLSTSESSPEATSKEDRPPKDSTWSLLQVWKLWSLGKEQHFNSSAARTLPKLWTGQTLEDQLPLCLKPSKFIFHNEIF